MPDRFTLRYLPVAQRDLVEIFDFIAEESPTRAVAFVDAIDARIGKLGQHPLLGRIPRHQKLREFGYRVLMVESYLVFYVVRKQVVEIHRVIHGSRNLDHIV